MAKKVHALIKLQIPAGQATPAPPIGPALGQHGVNIMEFCKAYNERTQGSSGDVIPVDITVYEDRSFTFVTKTPPASQLLLKAAGVEKGASQPNRERVGSVSYESVRGIAERKLADLNTADLDRASTIVAGTARSLGLAVEEPVAGGQ